VLLLPEYVFIYFTVAFYHNGSCKTRKGIPAQSLRSRIIPAAHQFGHFIQAPADQIRKRLRTSGTAPLERATTGVPQAMASIMIRPKGSSQEVGNSRQAAYFSRSCLNCPPAEDIYAFGECPANIFRYFGRITLC